jgi:CMP-N,N'-diacetyllegionaminic acid synthase
LILGLITARGGSKSIPRKNVLDVAGKPLIAWTIEAAFASESLDRTIVSTDDHEIAEVCRDWGAEVPFIRPPELARDDSSHHSVAVHALQWLENQEGLRPEYLMLLQPTSPLRKAEDIDGAIRFARERQADSVVGVGESERHPYLLQRITSDSTLVGFIADAPRPGSVSIRRQVLPPAYFVNGAIYLIKPDLLRNLKTFLSPGSLAYVLPKERSFEVDETWELDLVRMMLEKKNGD